MKFSMDLIAKYFLEYWTVNSPPTMELTTTINCLEGYTHPPSNTPYDLRIVVDAYFADSGGDASTVAYAASCHEDTITRRPITGITVINMAHFGTSDHEKYFQYDTILHEVMHVLGFSSYYYSKFYDFSTGTRRLRSYSEVITSKHYFK